MTKQRPNKPPSGVCPNESTGETKATCPLICKFNFFESDDLTIHTYELKCLDCGWRDTIGYRSDDSGDANVNPEQCPFCQQCDLSTGKNPCDSISS